MSRIYATEEGSGRRFLVRVECDGPGCEESIKPHPRISESGWTRYGQDHGPGTEKLEWDYCPSCTIGET